MFKKLLFCFLFLAFNTIYGQLSATVNVVNPTCFGNNDGLITIIATGGTSPYLFSITSPYYFSPRPSNVFTGLPAGNYNITVTDVNNVQFNTTAFIIMPPSLTMISLVTESTITFNATGGTPPYQYSLDGVAYTNSNIISNLQSGMYTIYVKDAKQCLDTDFAIIKPSSPIINNLNQAFTNGSTLADIIVTGQNIKWYATQSGNKIASSELPLSTVLIDGTTYYVSQTVNSVESEKSEITVTVGALSNEDFAFQNLKLYPIPAKDILKVANKTIIKKVVIYNYLGAEVLSTSIDKTDFEVNLRTLYKGVYFVKLESQEGQKTIKIIKE